jgi:hypothetical protein
MARRTRATVKEGLEEARKALEAYKPEAGTDHLGDLIWWDNEDGWRLPASKVHDAVVAHGLNPDHVLVMPPDQVVAFGRACDTIRVRMRDNDYTLMQAADGDNGETRMAVCRISRNGRVKTADEGTVVCPPTKSGIFPYVERSDPNGYAEAVVNLTRANVDVYTGEDMRASLVTTMDRYMALPCRKRSPYIVYFLPAAGADPIHKLSDALEAVGWGRVEFFEGYTHSKSSVRAATNAVNGGLEMKLQELAKDVDALCNKPAEATKPATVERLMEETKDLRSRWGLYRDLLGGAVASGDKKMQALNAVLAERLGVVRKLDDSKQNAKNSMRRSA